MSMVLFLISLCGAFSLIGVCRICHELGVHEAHGADRHHATSVYLPGRKRQQITKQAVQWIS